MRAVIRIIDPSIGRAVEFPQVVISREAIERQLWDLRAKGAEVYGVAGVYGYVVYL